MSPLYLRTSPGTRENFGAALVALGLGLGVASVSFYLVRTFLAREPMEPGPPEAIPSDEGGGKAAPGPTPPQDSG